MPSPSPSKAAPQTPAEVSPSAGDAHPSLTVPWGQRFGPASTWLSRNLELRLLWPALLLCVSVWGFAEIAGEVLEGDARWVDTYVLQALREPGQLGQPIGPVWLREAARDVTALGSPAVLMLTVAAVWGGLMLARERGMAWLALGSASGGLLMAVALKSLFTRSRPDAAFHATVASGYSFPSGHAMMSAVVFLTLSALAARLARQTRVRLYVMGLGCLLSGMVGLSRMYLGVHWLSDVAAGWAAGAAWAMLCWMLAQRLSLGREGQP
jgi:undecaprenyl-diphosphatase